MANVFLMRHQPKNIYWQIKKFNICKIGQFEISFCAAHVLWTLCYEYVWTFFLYRFSVCNIRFRWSEINKIDDLRLFLIILRETHNLTQCKQTSSSFHKQMTRNAWMVNKFWFLFLFTNLSEWFHECWLCYIR